LPTEFEDAGLSDGTVEEYRRRSDGLIVKFHCSDQASLEKALVLVGNGTDVGLVERTNVVDSSGTKIGERVVQKSRGYDAAIRWNEGARFFSIDAESLKDALLFEKSKPWGPGCRDDRSWP
jgi:hypothetical protein